jgi:asparagine synthase (glutamine-hydrolysing)
MCGIFGVVFSDGTTSPAEDRLNKSATLITHRGPDGVGIYSAPGIGLVHTRLSLVDLQQRSNQPMWSAERTHGLVYNGEIYNYQSLRAELVERGIELVTTSDTEVLLQLLIVDGVEKTLPRLQGMFAFAFYDVSKRRVVLARDRFGIKPLHIYRDDDKLVFSSEIKAMKPWVSLRPNHLQMIRYLMNYGAPVRDKGFYENIDIVPAGSVVIINTGSAPKTSRFADVLDMVSQDHTDALDDMNKTQIVDHVDELMQRSVQNMLCADAPVGALCSGGVDSSLIMAIAARNHNNLAIFHADVVGPLSEYDAAADLARHLKLDLQVVKTVDNDFIRLTPEVLFHYEQPFSGHPHSVPFMMVSRLVQESGVKGVLTGEGSDECFLGYEYIALEPLWEFYHRQTRRIRGLMERIPVIGQHLFNKRHEFPGIVPDMLGQFEKTLDRRKAREVYTQALNKPADLNVRSLDLLRDHLVTLLHRNDTMGMSAGIEARFPFLDEALIETAVNLPLRYKIRFSPGVWEKDHPFLRDKWVLRQVADRYLPKSLSQRKKLGFDVNAFRRMSIDKQFFNGNFIKDHFKLSRKEAEYLFETAAQPLSIKLMMLEMWGRLFIDDVPLSVVQDDLSSCASIRSFQ